MKLVTNDYGCGTSSSILDYGIEDVVVVSEDNWKHIFDLNDDLLFVGHDFLMYMWDTDEKVQQLKAYPHAKLIWCFERIDAIIPMWQQKSHFSISKIQNFADEILACDEDDCEKYGLSWLPQWASIKFYEQRHKKPTQKDNILFSGQAGKPEYQIRNDLLVSCQNSKISDLIKITNIDRSLTWDQYVNNFLNFQRIINPFGVLRAVNTRAYEAAYSGRVVFQHAVGEYPLHEAMLKEDRNIIFFRDFEDLIEKIEESKNILAVSEEEIQKSYNRHSLFARMKSIGIEIK